MGQSKKEKAIAIKRNEMRKSGIRDPRTEKDREETAKIKEKGFQRDKKAEELVRKKIESKGFDTSRINISVLK